QPVPCDLKAGDVLFFNGSVIHGSYPNTSQHRFRRAFICHYVGESTIGMSHWYYPLHTFAGEPISREDNPGGGPCGTEQLELLQNSFKAQTEKLEAQKQQPALAR
ncbi:MAG: phytanoyl-CoA dioxygenase family protein, partial [Abitibacteriaceae bacterium]|nr:phytanoyl-CoA dioxygenase family protein [Abditibacteriaceae bacterium]